MRTMRQGLRSTLLVLGALAGASPAAATSVSHYVPAGEWESVTLPVGCRSARQFTDGRNRVSLWLDRYGPGAPLVLGVAGGGIRPFPRARETRISFLPVGMAEQQVEMFRAVLGQDNLPVVFFPDVQIVRQPDWANLPAEEARQLRGVPHPADEELRLAQDVGTISISGGLVRAIDLATGPLTEPVTALQNCTDEMLRGWGLDPVAQNHLSRRVAMIDNQLLPLAFGYPAAQMRERQGASIGGYLLVDREGQVTQCHLTMPSDIQAFNEEACRTLTSRIWFDPALDAEGRPVDSYFTLSLRFAVTP